MMELSDCYATVVETGLFLLLNKEDPEQSYKHFSIAVEAANSKEKKIDLIQYQDAAAAVLIRAQLEIGDNFARHGQYGSALETYSSITNAQNTTPTIQFQIEHNVGTCLAQLGRKDEALVYYLNAYKRNPTSMKTLKNIAILLADIGKYSDAIIVFDEYLLAHPKSYSAMCGKSGCLKDLKLYKQSILVAEKAQSLDPLQKRDRCAQDLKIICDQEILKLDYIDSRIVSKDKTKVDSIVPEDKLDMKAYFDSVKREENEDNSNEYCLPQRKNNGRFLYRSKQIDHRSIPLEANKTTNTSPFCVQIPGNDLLINGTPYRINSHQSYCSERESASASSLTTQQAVSISESCTGISARSKAPVDINDARNTAISLLLRQSPGTHRSARSSMALFSDDLNQIQSSNCLESTLEEIAGQYVTSPLSVSVAIHEADRCKEKGHSASHHPSGFATSRLNHTKKSSTETDRSEMIFRSIALNSSLNEVAKSPTALIPNSLGTRKPLMKSTADCHIPCNNNVSPQTSQTDIELDFACGRNENRKWLQRSNDQMKDSNVRNFGQATASLQNQSARAESMGNLKRLAINESTKFDKTTSLAIATGVKKTLSTSQSSTTMSNFSSSSSSEKPQRRRLSNLDHSLTTLDNYFDIPSTIAMKQADQYRKGPSTQYRRNDGQAIAPYNK